MIIICHHYKYLKLIKSKATKLFPEPERSESIKVSNTSTILYFDSKIKAWFSWTITVFFIIIFRKLKAIGVYRALSQIKLPTLLNIYKVRHLSVKNALPVFVPFGSSEDSTEIHSINLRKTSMAAICLDSCGPHIIFFQLTISEKKYVNEMCSKTTGQKWI